MPRFRTTPRALQRPRSRKVQTSLQKAWCFGVVAAFSAIFEACQAIGNKTTTATGRTLLWVWFLVLRLPREGLASWTPQPSPWHFKKSGKHYEMQTYLGDYIAKRCKPHPQASCECRQELSAQVPPGRVRLSKKKCFCTASARWGPHVRKFQPLVEGLWRAMVGVSSGLFSDPAWAHSAQVPDFVTSRDLNFSLSTSIQIHEHQALSYKPRPVLGHSFTLKYMRAYWNLYSKT